MRHRTHSKKLHKNQEGALLLIALVLLGVIVLSTVYLSLVLLSEIKSTRYTDNGIVSHYVAESGIENALWKLKLAKQDGDPDQFTDLGLSPLATGQCAAEDDGVGATCSDPERTYDFTKVAISASDYTVYNVPRNSVITADIYNPSIEGQTGQNTGIEEIKVDWSLESCSGSDRLESTYTPVDIDNITVEPTRTQVDVCTCSGGACETEIVGNLSGSKFYRFTFRSLDANVKTFKMYASAASTDIPSQVEIQATGTYRESQKKITARTLWLDALSGLFGFVVFSEQSLIKDAKSLTGQAYGPRCGFCSFSTPTTKSGCSTDADCQQCVAGVCLDGTSCPTGTECNSFTCSIENNTTDTVDAAATAWFCPLETTGGETASPILQTNAGSCNAYCNGYTFCGDGTIQTPNGSGDGFPTDGVPGKEQCDAGGANSDTAPLACRTDCQTPYCGDGIVDFGDFNNNGVLLVPKPQETCDDGNRTSHTGNNINEDECSTACILTVCGDTIINNNPTNSLGVLEECDDGNTSSGDGCDSDCQDET